MNEDHLDREPSWKADAIAQGYGADFFGSDDNPQNAQSTPPESTTIAKNPELDDRSRQAIQRAYAKVLENTGIDPNEEKKKHGSRRPLERDKSVPEDSDDDEQNMTPRKYPPPKGYGPTITWDKPSFEFDSGAFEPMRKPPKFNFDVEFEESMPPEKMEGTVVDGVLSAVEELDGTFHISECTNCRKKLRVKKMALLLECPVPECKHVMPNTTTAA